ncbi:MAG: diacylglycerol kinase family protein [Phycisphaerae bacterium]
MIVNPISGGRPNEALAETLRARLTAAGERVEVCHTTARGDARQRAATLDGAVSLVIAVGGDGTVNEVCDGLVGRSTPLLIVPRGTENLLARLLGLTDDAPRVVATALAPRVVPFDVGIANRRRFLCVSGVGFDGEVIRRLEARRRGHIGHWTYFRPIWEAFWTWGFPRLRVEVDGQCVFDDRGLAFVGNIRRYALGLRILRDARPDDGLLDVCCYRCASRARLLVHSGLTLLRRHVGRRGVNYFRGRVVRVTAAEPLPVEMDGESFGATPIEYSILPGAVRLVAGVATPGADPQRDADAAARPR